MTSSSTAYTHGVKCSLQALKGGVEAGLELGLRTSLSIFRKGDESSRYQAW